MTNIEYDTCLKPVYLAAKEDLDKCIVKFLTHLDLIHNENPLIDYQINFFFE